MHYKVIMSGDGPFFDKQVTEHLREGWQIAGGVCVSHPPCNARDRDQRTEVRYVYSQAMTMPDKITNRPIPAPLKENLFDK
jgi:hypothetical protein